MWLWRSTWVASTTTRPAPELASMPRWVMCQSLAQPSLALYWHIGETTMRLSSSTPASLMGENSEAAMNTPLIGGKSERRGTPPPSYWGRLRRRNTRGAIVFHAGFGHLQPYLLPGACFAGPARA